MELSGFYGAVHLRRLTAAKPLTHVHVCDNNEDREKRGRLIQTVAKYSCDYILFSLSDSPSY